MVIPEAIFQTGSVNFGSVGGLDTLNIGSGFCAKQSTLFLPII